MALRDYRKGKYLLENRPGQLLPIGNAKDPMSSQAAEHQQRRVLHKIWNIVEQSMEELRRVLISQLQDSSRSVEEQEKTLECVFMALPLIPATHSWHPVFFRVLSELQSSDDPAWTYFDSHHKHILDQMTNVYHSSVGTMEGKPERELFPSNNVRLTVKIATRKKTNSNVTGASDELAERLRSHLQIVAVELEGQKREIIFGEELLGLASPDHKIFFSEVPCWTCVAFYTQHGQECLGGRAVIAPHILENLQKFYGRKINQGLKFFWVSRTPNLNYNHP